MKLCDKVTLDLVRENLSEDLAFEVTYLGVEEHLMWTEPHTLGP